MTMQAPATTSLMGEARWAELDAIDELICGLYGQDSATIHQLDAQHRERFRKELDAILQGLRDWRHKWGEGHDTERVQSIIPNLRAKQASSDTGAS